jgi:hypothetical protein
VGIPGNEAADSKRITERGNSPHRNIFPTGLDSMDKRKTRTRATRKMGKLDHNHQRAQNTPHNEHQREQVEISRLRTGYTRATHSAVMDKEPSPGCPFCAVNLTTDHILWHCKETETKRKRIDYKWT